MYRPLSGVRGCLLSPVKPYHLQASHDYSCICSSFQPLHVQPSSSKPLYPMFKDELLLCKSIFVVCISCLHLKLSSYVLQDFVPSHANQCSWLLLQDLCVINMYLLTSHAGLSKAASTAKLGVSQLGKVICFLRTCSQCPISKAVESVDSHHLIEFGPCNAKAVVFQPAVVLPSCGIQQNICIAPMPYG